MPRKPTASTTPATMLSPRPLPGKMLRAAGRPSVSATEAMKKITATTIQRPSACCTIRRVSPLFSLVGESREAKARAIAPVTSAAADTGTQSNRMAEP